MRNLVLGALTCLLALTGCGGKAASPDEERDQDALEAVSGSKIFGTGDKPAVSNASDGSAVELGLRFRSESEGKIVVLRFYKGKKNTGSHIGNLWSNGGDKLASVVFKNETRSGWQYALLDTPVAIAAQKTYVVSYFAPAGHYSYTNDAFASAGLDRPPLHALKSGLDGLNGVYRYGSESGFPQESYRTTNYFVDVVFQKGAPVCTPSCSGKTGVPPGTALKAVPGQVTSGTGWHWDSRGWVEIDGDGAVFSGFRTVRCRPARQRHS